MLIKAVDGRVIGMQVTLVDTDAEQGVFQVLPATHHGAARAGTLLRDDELEGSVRPAKEARSKKEHSETVCE